MRPLKASSRGDRVRFVAWLLPYMCVTKLPRGHFLEGTPLAVGESGDHRETTAITPVRRMPDVWPPNEFKRARYYELAAFQQPEEIPGSNVLNEVLKTRQPSLHKGAGKNPIQAGPAKWIDGMEDMQAMSDEAHHRSCSWPEQNGCSLTAPTSPNSLISDHGLGFNPDSFLEYENFIEMCSALEVEQENYSSNQGTADPRQPQTQPEPPEHKLEATHDSKQSLTQELKVSQTLSPNQLKQSTTTSIEPFILNVEPPDIPIPDNRTLPIFTVNPKSTYNCMRRFDEVMKNWPNGNRGCWSNHLWFIDMPVALVSVWDQHKSNRPLSVIRLNAPSTSSNNLFKFPFDIKALFSLLVKWVLYDYAAAQSLLERLGHHTQDKEEEILDWLVNELFSPKKGSLPVTGIVQIPVLAHDRRAFGPVQRLFIDNIYVKRNPMHQTACQIVGIWYKNFDHATWNLFLEDAEFWIFMRKAIAAAGNFYQIKNTQIGSSQGNGCIAFEGFEMYDLELLSEHLPKLGRQTGQTQFRRAKALVVSSGVESTLNEIEKQITSIIMMYGNLCKSKKKQTFHQFPFSDELISLAVIKIQGGGEYYVIQLLDISRFPISSRDISRRLHLFQKGLISYLTVLVASLENPREYMIEDAHTNIANWFYKQLFEPEGSLPLFGIIKQDVPKTDQFFFKPFQKYLINCLTRPYPHLMYAQIFSTIVGYWYKTMCPKLWNLQFGNEQNYWNFMARALMIFQVPKIGLN